MVYNRLTDFQNTEIGTLPLNWTYATIKEVGGSNAVLTGPFGSLLHSRDYSDHGTPLLLVNSFEHGKLTGKEIPKVADEKAAELKKYWLKEGDIVFSRVGEVGRTLYVDQTMVNWMFSGQTLRIRIENKNIFNRFVELYLRTPSAKKYSEATSLGTTRPSINTEILSNRIIPIPPLQQQQAIAKILSDLDSKIELNQQMNKTLESIAQTIFKHWFIDFEFPDENGQPYKSSGGEMVDSELGEIPKGWKVDSIKELFEFQKGIEPGSKNYVKSKGDSYLPFYRVHDIANYGNRPDTYIDRKLVKDKIFRKEDILVSLDGTIGRVYFGGAGSYSTGIRKVISRKPFLGNELIFTYLKSDNFQNSLTRMFYRSFIFRK